MYQILKIAAHICVYFMGYLWLRVATEKFMFEKVSPFLNVNSQTEMLHDCGFYYKI